MSFRKQLKQAWGALAYADAGEFLPYAEKCRVLGVEPPPGCRGYLPPREAAPRRAVALHLGPDLDPRACGYALDMAQRLEAGLVLLRPPVAASEAAVAELVQRIDAAGIQRQEVMLKAPWVDSVADLLRRRADIVCLVLAPTDLDPRARAAVTGPHRRAFSAPVVVVEGALPQPV